MNNLSTIAYALLGGVLPALVWLLFWLREDRRDPEPKGLILKTFLFGMIAVALVLPFQKGVEMLLPGMSFLPIILWASLEETFKLCAGYFGGLHSVEDNEPVDPMIYMITAALGFVALENALFIFTPLLGDEVVQGVITVNLRFIGASLLHVVSSGIVGIGLSFTFYRPLKRRIGTVLLALIGAIAFHVFFNLLIVIWKEVGTAAAFIVVWIGVAALLVAFEKAKMIAPKA